MAETENAPITSRGPLIDFGSEGVKPPSMLYIDRDDRLYIRSWNSITTGMTIVVRGDLLHPDGRIRPFEFRHTPLTSGLPSLQIETLAEGFLIGLSVRGDGVAVPRGATLVDVGILRGRGVTGQEQKTLIGGYVEFNRVLSYPPTYYEPSGSGTGAQTPLATADPAAGAEVSHTVPVNEQWRMTTFRVALVCDGTAANRFPRLRIFRSGIEVWRSRSHDAQTAGQTAVYNFVLGGFFEATVQNGEHSNILPDGRLQGNDTIQTTTTGLQAGDNYTAGVAWLEVWMRQQV